MSETSTGLQQNVAGVLCYVLGWLSGIIMLILEPKNSFVKFHAFQSILAFGVLTVFYLIFFKIPFIGFAVSIIVWVIWFIIWLSMMLVAAQDKKYKLPYAGNYAEKWAGQ